MAIHRIGFSKPDRDYTGKKNSVIQVTASDKRVNPRELARGFGEVGHSSLVL